jgi:sulfatase maturation enzyme AslB (radical SAM superfamily)
MIDKGVYCSMIHGGLNLNFKSGLPHVQSCCLRGNDSHSPVDNSTNLWNQQVLLDLRHKNQQNIWDDKCSDCQQLEQSNLPSMRTGMNDGLAIAGKTELSGPARIDLVFDISCNLACRTCGTHSSTFWQKHLKEHGRWAHPIFSPRHSNKVIHSLQQLDLSNLRQVVFCGGETMLGQSYWDVAEWLANNVPNAQQQLTVCFQTNGTQSISAKNINIIEKLHLVKLHISLDGVEEQFEYLRWPASWSQVTQNIFDLRETSPSNVMFLIEETISIFNFAYTNRLEQWVNENFTTNREGDQVDHTRHLAHGMFGLHNLTEQYIQSMSGTPYKNLIAPNLPVNPIQIKHMLYQIDQHDQLRGQSFAAVFPEVAEYYKQYI